MISIIDYTKQMHLTGVNYRIGYLASTLYIKIKDSLHALSFYTLNKQ